MDKRWTLPLLRGSTVEMIEATPEDVAHVADNLKRADKEEAFATFGHCRFRDIMRLSIASAESCLVAVSAYGEPIGVLGVRTLSLIHNIGVPWLVTVGCTQRHRRALMVLGHEYTAAMLQRYDTLTNNVDARNAESIAWLRRLGYAFEDARPFGPFNLPFHRFTIAR